MSQKLDYRTIVEGDMLADFCQVQQRRIHYLVVEVFKTHLGFDDISLWRFKLQPLDSNRDWDVVLTHHDFQKPYCTWRRVA